MLPFQRWQSKKRFTCNTYVLWRQYEQAIPSRRPSQRRPQSDVSIGLYGSECARYLRSRWSSAGLLHHHFRSKDAFALEVLDRYFAGTKQFVKEALDDKSLTPRQRLKRYLDIISGVAADRKWNLGCLIGDFSLETSTQSKLLRRRLEAIFEEWRAPFASCIAEAQALGEIDSSFDPMDLAEFLLASWEGAILRMKVERSPAALDRFKDIDFETVFSKPNSRSR